MQAVQKPQTKQMHDRKWKEVKTVLGLGMLSKTRPAVPLVNIL